MRPTAFHGQTLSISISNDQIELIPSQFPQNMANLFKLTVSMVTTHFRYGRKAYVI